MHASRILGVSLVVWAAVLGLAHAQEPKSGTFQASDGVKIHYLTAGAQGSWVVLVHGYRGSAQGNWFDNGVAQALAKNHRVVAIDCRNHGQSDRPEPGGRGIARDVIELMDHLEIERAHVHGYSMGGGITARLMAEIPDRLLSASFGGSGVRETDPELAAEAAARDPKGEDPAEAKIGRQLRITSLLRDGLTREEAERRVEELEAQARAARAAQASADVGAAAAATEASSATPQVAAGGPTPPPAPNVDLGSIAFPVMAIVGEYDQPYSRTARMRRELKDFELTILPGKSHLTAIVAGHMPQKYVDTLVAFVDEHDAK